MRSTRLAALASVATVITLAPLAPAQAEPGSGDDLRRPVTQSHWAPGSDEARLELRCSTRGPRYAGASIVEDSAEGHTFTVVVPDGSGGYAEQAVLAEEPFVDGWSMTATQALKDTATARLHGRVEMADWPENVYEATQDDLGGTTEKSGWSAPLTGHGILTVTTRVPGRKHVSKQRYLMTCEGYARSVKVTRHASLVSPSV